MSKVQLAGNANGTGIFTIASPNSNTDRTINLPDATGTVQVSGNPISGTTGTFTGLLDISASTAGQIQFPATQNASSNANTLDDYEEGTWTPTIYGAGVAGTYTPNSANGGWYRKVGSLVIAGFNANGVVSGASGQLRISGMPFPNSSDGPGNSGYSSGALQYADGSGYNLMGPLTPPGTSYVYFHSYDGDSSGPADVVNTTYNLHAIISYRAA